MNLAQYLRRQLKCIDEIEADCAESEHYDLDIVDGWQTMLARCARKAAEAGNAEVFKALKTTATSGDHVRETIARALSCCQSDVLNVAEAAAKLGISTRKVYELCSKGLLKHTKQPIRIKASDLEIKQQRHPAKNRPLRHLR